MDSVVDRITPLAGLVQATDGNFYGANSGGGKNGFGTIFKITSQGAFTKLYDFDGTYRTSAIDNLGPAHE